MSGVDTAIPSEPRALQPGGGYRLARGDCRRVGVHRAEGDLHLERLWSRTPRSSRAWWTLVQSGKLDPAQLMTHRCRFDQILDGYDAFARAPATRAPKAPIEFTEQ